MPLDFIPHVMTAVEIASIIAVELEYPDDRMAGNMRTAAWYCLEIDLTITGLRFADGAALIGLHHQGARNRFSEASRMLVREAA